MQETTDILTGLLFGGLVLSLYFAPALVASFRHHRNGPSIFLTNLFFGWTILGWLAALIWAFSFTGSTDDD